MDKVKFKRQNVARWCKKLGIKKQRSWRMQGKVGGQLEEAA